MKLALYTNSVSAHQLPLSRELVARLGVDSYRYVYTGDQLQGGGQEVSDRESWIIRHPLDSAEMGSGNDSFGCQALLETCDVLMVGGLRPIELIELRALKGLKTFYCTELWFKPIPLFDLRLFDRLILFRLPGRVRMLVPGYRRMAKRFVAWMQTDPNARCLAIGPWAKDDMLWLGVPSEKIVDWGYFVEPGKKELWVRGQELGEERGLGGDVIKVLWVGRMLDWKRVETIIRAVYRANEMLAEQQKKSDHHCPSLFSIFSLTLVGDGPEKVRLQKLADKLQKKLNHYSSTSYFNFSPPVKITEVRPLMRNHDIYVLASNTQEGWGAALNEAMEEGMTCFGTYEAGASAALLPRSNLFRTGDWRSLADLLVLFAEQQKKDNRHCPPPFSTSLPREYTPSGAADKLLELIS